MVVQQDAGLSIPALLRELKRRAQSGHSGADDHKIDFFHRIHLIKINRESSIKDTMRRLDNFRRISVRITERADTAVPIPVGPKR